MANEASRVKSLNWALRSDFVKATKKKTVIIEKISDQRRGAPVAQTLYRETNESIAKREEHATQRKLNAHNPSPERRPDKKQRRDIIKFKHQ